MMCCVAVWGDVLEFAGFTRMMFVFLNMALATVKPAHARFKTWLCAAGCKACGTALVKVISLAQGAVHPLPCPMFFLHAGKDRQSFKAIASLLAAG